MHKPAAVPLGDDARVRFLKSLNILDTEKDVSFDRITEAASTITHSPIALVSLVDGNRQWFKSKVGLDVSETSRDLAFCAHAIAQADGKIFVVSDALEDERFKYSDLVLGAPYIRFYAGAPLVMSGEDGFQYKIGTLCVIDQKPRNLEGHEYAVMETLAKLVVTEIDKHRGLSNIPINVIQEFLEVRFESMRHACVICLHHAPSLKNHSGLVTYAPRAAQLHERRMPTLFDDLPDPEGAHDFSSHGALSITEAEALWRTFLLGRDTTVGSCSSPPATSSGSCSSHSSTSCDGCESADGYYKEEEEDEGDDGEGEEGSCSTDGSSSACSSGSKRGAARSPAAMLGRLRLAHAPPPAAIADSTAQRRGGRARSESDSDSLPTAVGGAGGRWWVDASDPSAGRRRRRLSVDGEEEAPAQP